jgi:Ecdysteroid kinase-like family
VVLVDFQLINYGHPAYDILYLLYLSADTAFRDAHMQEMCSAAFFAQYSPSFICYQIFALILNPDTGTIN